VSLSYTPPPPYDRNATRNIIRMIINGFTHVVSVPVSVSVSVPVLVLVLVLVPCFKRVLRCSITSIQ